MLFHRDMMPAGIQMYNIKPSNNSQEQRLATVTGTKHKKPERDIAESNHM